MLWATLVFFLACSSLIKLSASASILCLSASILCLSFLTSFSTSFCFYCSWAHAVHFLTEPLWEEEYNHQSIVSLTLFCSQVCTHERETCNALHRHQRSSSLKKGKCASNKEIWWSRSNTETPWAQESSFYTELLCSRSTMLEQRVSAFMIRSSGVWMLRANLRAMVIYLKEWKAATWIWSHNLRQQAFGQQQENRTKLCAAQRSSDPQLIVLGHMVWRVGNQRVQSLQRGYIITVCFVLRAELWKHFPIFSQKYKLWIISILMATK